MIPQTISYSLLKGWGAYYMICFFFLYVCVSFSVFPESLKSQLDQGEEKTSKMKQLLVKTKKDLADAKKQVCFGCLLCVSECGSECVLKNIHKSFVILVPDECKYFYAACRCSEELIMSCDDLLFGLCIQLFTFVYEFCVCVHAGKLSYDAASFSQRRAGGSPTEVRKLKGKIQTIKQSRTSQNNLFNFS